MREEIKLNCCFACEINHCQNSIGIIQNIILCFSSPLSFLARVKTFFSSSIPSCVLKQQWVCVCVCPCVCVLSCVQLFSTPWTVAHQTPLHGILQARILDWVAISSSKGSSWCRDRTHVSCISCIGRRILYHLATWEAPHWSIKEGI